MDIFGFKAIQEISEKNSSKILFGRHNHYRNVVPWRNKNGATHTRWAKNSPPQNYKWTDLELLCATSLASALVSCQQQPQLFAYYSSSLELYWLGINQYCGLLPRYNKRRLSICQCFRLMTCHVSAGWSDISRKYPCTQTSVIHYGKRRFIVSYSLFISIFSWISVVKDVLYEDSLQSCFLLHIIRIHHCQPTFCCGQLLGQGYH